MAARTAQGLTQQQLAAKLAVDRSLIRYYERDTKNPNVGFVIRCAAALGIPLEALVDRSRSSDSGDDQEFHRFVRRLSAMDPKERNFAVHLFMKQLPALRERGAVPAAVLTRRAKAIADAASRLRGSREASSRSSKKLPADQ